MGRNMEHGPQSSPQTLSPRRAILRDLVEQSTREAGELAGVAIGGRLIFGLFSAFNVPGRFLELRRLRKREKALEIEFSDKEDNPKQDEVQGDFIDRAVAQTLIVLAQRRELKNVFLDNKQRRQVGFNIFVARARALFRHNHNISWVDVNRIADGRNVIGGRRNRVFEDQLTPREQVFVKTEEEGNILDTVVAQAQSSIATYEVSATRRVAHAIREKQADKAVLTGQFITGTSVGVVGFVAKETIADALISNIAPHVLNLIIPGVGIALFAGNLELSRRYWRLKRSIDKFSIKLMQEELSFLDSLKNKSGLKNAIETRRNQIKSGLKE